MNNELNYDKLRSMIACCEWTFAKSMPFAPHEYIVKDKCPLTMEEFEYFVNMQREHGVKERWGKYNNPYLYIDDYKYWTMGAPLEDTTVINRAKANAVNDVHQLYEGINKGDTTMSHVDEYIHEQLGLKDDKGFNIELINGRLKEIFDCVGHLERIRNNYACEVMQEWSDRISAFFPDCKIVEDIRPGDIIYTGITIPYKDIPDAIAVRIQMEKRSLYYGLTYMPAIKEKRAELQETMSFINSDGGFIKGSDWLYYKYTSFKYGYWDVEQLIIKMKHFINKIPEAVCKAASFPFEVILLGDYKNKKVYGYTKAPYDDGRGFGIPHIILFDGQNAEVVLMGTNKELEHFFD